MVLMVPSGQPAKEQKMVDEMCIRDRNEGDPRFHIVFYPLYPLTVMVFRFLFMGNTILSAVFVSNICLIVSGVLMYDLVLKEQDRAGARRAVAYLMFCPLSLFYSIPYSEALFLMLCLLSVVLARRRHFGWAVFCGALCAATRSLGVLIAAPVSYTHLDVYKRQPQAGAYKAGAGCAGERQSGDGHWGCGFPGHEAAL